jgi:hypothetical protein
VNSIEKLCFVLVERQKANKLRRKYLARHNAAKEALKKHYLLRTHPLKHPKAAEFLKESKDSHESYRRIADLMNDQRPLLRQLRKDNTARMIYDASNRCTNLKWNNVNMVWKDIIVLANQYAFESIVLKDSTFVNPYAKELYGKEAKQEENNTPD